MRFGHALRGRQNVKAFVTLWTEEVPAALQVADEGVSLVLRGDADAANAGIQRVRKCKIDNAGLAAKINRWFCPAVCQFLQTASSTARENIGHCITRQGLNSFSDMVVLPFCLSVFRFEHDRCQGRQDEHRPDFTTGIDRLNASAISLAAAAINFGIGVENLPPPPRNRKRHIIVFPVDRGQIADNRNRFSPGAERSQAKTEFS